MPQRKTVAVIGLSKANIILLATKIAQYHTVLLFDTDAILLNEVYLKMHSENPNSTIEIVNCPIDASWEADVILFSDSFFYEEELIQKIKKVTTGKVILILWSQNMDLAVDMDQAKIRNLFPFSKVFSIAVKSDNYDDFFLKDKDNENIQSVMAFLSANC